MTHIVTLRRRLLVGDPGVKASQVRRQLWVAKMDFDEATSVKALDGGQVNGYSCD